jgi:hypothetical protein
MRNRNNLKVRRAIAPNKQALNREHNGGNEPDFRVRPNTPFTVSTTTRRYGLVFGGLFLVGFHRMRLFSSRTNAHNFIKFLRKYLSKIRQAKKYKKIKKN